MQLLVSSPLVFLLSEHYLYFAQFVATVSSTCSVYLLICWMQKSMNGADHQALKNCLNPHWSLNTTLFTFRYAAHFLHHFLQQFLHHFLHDFFLTFLITFNNFSRLLLFVVHLTILVSMTSTIYPQQDKLTFECQKLEEFFFNCQKLSFFSKWAFFNDNFWHFFFKF